MSYGKVHVDVTEARAGSREAILVDVLPEVLTPGAAATLAADIREAVVIVDRLAPPRAVGPGYRSTNFGPHGQVLTDEEALGFPRHADEHGRRGD